MLAIVYIAFMFWVGDAICRRIFRFASVPHRLAAAFLVGALVSSWFTYLTARIFASTTRPLLWGDLIFFAATIGAFVWARRRERTVRELPATEAATSEPEAASETTQTVEALESSTEVSVRPAGEQVISGSPASAEQVSVAPAEGVFASSIAEDKMPARSGEPISAPTANPDGVDGHPDQHLEVPVSLGNAADSSELASKEGSTLSENSDEDLADEVEGADYDSASTPAGSYLPRPAGSDRLDWIFVGAYFIFACWLMFASLNSTNGKLEISGRIASDFGPNTALVQSFAVGKNFPTQYPHYAGEKIRYHFLFWFQAGNLEFLGLDPAWSINLLSIFSLVSLLMLTMVLGEVLFRSRVVGRVGSALFFFFGSLSYIPFLRKQGSVAAALHSIANLDGFLPSGYPYRGEEWGFYTQNIFINQRHISGAIGILLLVLVFLVLRYRAVPVKKFDWREWKEKLTRPPVAADAEEAEDSEDENEEDEASEEETEAESGAHASGLDTDGDQIQATAGETSEGKSAMSGGPSEKPAPPEADEVSAASVTDREVESEADETSNDSDDDEDADDEISASPPDDEPPAPPPTPAQPFWPTVPGFIFSGVLLGLLPMWNAAVFAAAFALLLALFILLPLKKQMLALAIPAGILALPQVIYLSSGGFHDPGASVIHWGYLMSPPNCELCLTNPSIWMAIKYLGFTVGFKWILVALALLLASSLQRRFFAAALSLVVLTFLFQFSVEIAANHKFLHVWIIVVNLFVAYGLYRLWIMKTVPIAGRVAAVVLTALIVTGGVIDLFPIHNSGYGEADFKNDPLVNWVRANTKGDAIFLSDRFVAHPILLAGRKIFFGWQYFTWSAGYDLGKREPAYRKMFESRDPAEVFQLLKANAIDYIAYDDGIRRSDYFTKPNEQVYAKNFPKVWEDKDHHYGNLVIYKVPDTAPAGALVAPEPGRQAPAAPVSMFTGGRGDGPGQFNNPEGLTIDRAGNILVADMSNNRVQKFSPKGDFISSFGQKGAGEGEFADPFAVAIDRGGNLYVVEAGAGRIQKFKPDGTSGVIWKRTVDELDLYGPRKAAFGPDEGLYVVDMGHARIIKFNVNGRQTAHWGTNGDADGQFRDMTSVAVDPKENKVYVADPGNKRIQIFDPNGNFLGKWPVDEWGTFYGFEDLAIDPQARRLYASSATREDILVFDLNTGNRLPPLQPKPPDKLESPTAIALSKGKLYVLNNRTARVSVIDLAETKNETKK
jgi:DNA-binding beta-propeller fold protein YncE